MNKEGKIVLIDSHERNRAYLEGCLKGVGSKNEVVAFGDTESAQEYVAKHLSEIFLLLQSTESPRLEVPDTRNMIYMHEKFNNAELPYMFIVNTSPGDPKGLKAFIHCYYKSSDNPTLSDTLCDVVLFWKEHIFPPKITYYT